MTTTEGCPPGSGWSRTPRPEAVVWPADWSRTWWPTSCLRSELSGTAPFRRTWRHWSSPLRSALSGEAKTSLYDSRRRELPSTRSTAGFLPKLDVVLDPGEMSTFEDRGFVKLEAVVNRDRLAGLAAAAWMALSAQFGISDDRTTWPLGARKTVRRAVRDDPAFVELGTSTITVLVDRVLGAGSWAPPRHWGATMEVVFPALDAGPWRLPTTPWHLDFPFHQYPPSSLSWTR